MNNFNEVTFAAIPATDNSTGIYVSDVSGRDATTAAHIGDLTTDGLTFIGVMQNGLDAHSMNDKGQIAFFGRVRGEGGTTYNAVIRADPMPGVSPGQPILPDPDSFEGEGVWRFAVNAPPPGRRFYDPEISIGYEYYTEGDLANFADVYIPAPLPNGDRAFTLIVSGQSFELLAGQVFDFTSIDPLGVASFKIVDIDTSEALDPADPMAFVTGLSFVDDGGSGNGSMLMKPILAVPELATWAQALGGLLVLFVLGMGKERKRAQARVSAATIRRLGAI
jgi:hypothetical protein